MPFINSLNLNVMNKKHKTKQVEPDEVLTLEESTNEVGEQSIDVWEPGQSEIRYVVTRSGLRVSDKDYPSKNEPRAIIERDFWQNVVNSWPDGTKIDIVQYDKKRHRIW